jgi:uncharacterized membrane protein
MGARSFVWAVVLLTSLTSVWGATLYGNVYDLSLRKVDGAILEVNTTPSQFFIATDGAYSFEVSRGVYEIAAKEQEDGHIVGWEQRNITVPQEGRYVIDFILFPVIEEDKLDEVDFAAVVGDNNSMVGVTVVIILAAVAVYVMYYRKAPAAAEKDEQNGKKDTAAEEKSVYGDDEYVEKILEFVKKRGGRTTQKDIRKEIPLSEAKISLLIAELEHKGKFEKIKKGRGNIIILK